MQVMDWEDPWEEIYQRRIYSCCSSNKEKVQPLVDEINKMGKGKCYGYGVDARKEEKVIEWIAEIENKYGPIEFACYNIGANVRFGITETTSRVYYKVWEMACFGGFLFGKECAKYMKKRGKGCIIFSGATASIRGKEGFRLVEVS